MLESLGANYSHRAKAAALYEIARTYVPNEVPIKSLPAELNILTMGMFGGDFFDIKGAAEAVVRSLGVNIADVAFGRDAGGDLSFLHPGRSAVISADGMDLGYVGEVHPDVAESYGIGTRAYLSVLELDALLPLAAEPAFKPLPRYPGMARDIAVVCGRDVPVAGILAAIREAGGEILDGAAFFDEYTGKGIEEGKRSLAFSLSFRHPERTLVEKETADVMNNILKALSQKFGAVLRE
jgi:phenylalanyl-tRNA synthetase beta chain